MSNSMAHNGSRAGAGQTPNKFFRLAWRLHAVSGIESWHRSTKKISAEELEQNMVAILIDGLKATK